MKQPITLYSTDYAARRRAHTIEDRVIFTNASEIVRNAGALSQADRDFAIMHRARIARGLRLLVHPFGNADAQPIWLRGMVRS